MPKKSSLPYPNLRNVAALYSIPSAVDTESPSDTTVDTSAEGKPFGVPLNEIQLRTSDTRSIDYLHAFKLARSMVVLGLLEPIVIDKQKRLLAGGHRREGLLIIKEGSPQALQVCLPVIQTWENEEDKEEAIQLLTEGNPDAWMTHFKDGLIPVRVMDFDADEDPGLALQIEVAENDHRKDYTPAEVKLIAQRLKQAGYVERPGRPRQGEKALKPALHIALGKSMRTIQRYLKDDDIATKTLTDVIVSKELSPLQNALKNLKKWQQLDKPMTATRKQLMKAMPDFMELLQATFNEVQGESELQKED